MVKRDPAHRFQFASLQSDLGKKLVSEYGVEGIDSIVLISDGRAWVRSSAGLRVARGLSFPWNLLYALIIVPRPIRDFFYDIIASHRYRWFGTGACMLPTPELKDRFLG